MFVCRLCEGKGERDRVNVVYVHYVMGRERGTEYVCV